MENNVHETIFHCADDYFESVIQDINAAKKNVDIQMYTFTQDKLGQKIMDALLSAHRNRNVSIRLIVDGAGSPFWGGKLVKKMESYGIKTKVFNPYPWGIWQWRRSNIQSSFLKHVWQLIIKINSRNHRKSILIDDRIMYIGSMNIDQRHLSFKSGGQNWRDTAIRIQGKNFASIKDAFNNVWEQKKAKNIEHMIHSLNSKFKLNHNLKTRIRLYRNLLKTLTSKDTNLDH